MPKLTSLTIFAQTTLTTSHPTQDLNDIVSSDWVERWLPKSWQPYAHLCRLDRPIGIWLTLLPCLTALVQAAGGLPTLQRLIVFSLGALLMRGIGCTINDMWDRDIDKHVERTRLRPLTSGQLTLKQAVICLVVQLLICAALLYFINPFSRWLALVLLPLVFIYPFCKRITYWPQAVLGICFNWGMLMAWSDTRNALPLAAIAMWLGAVLWQIGYDSLYAYVDVHDDKKLGLRSTAMRFDQYGRQWIGGFYLTTLVLWAGAGWQLGAGWEYLLGLSIIAAHFTWQIALFDPHKPARNFMLFRANLWVGIVLISAALGATL